MSEGISFELYKLLIEEVREARKARRDLSNTFLTLNLAGVGALGFLAKGEAASLENAALMFWCAGALAIMCWIWRTTNKYYTRLLNAKYTVLYSVEDTLQAALGERPIRREYDMVLGARPNRVFFSLEYTMPALFILGYGIFLAQQLTWTDLTGLFDTVWAPIGALIGGGG